MKKKRLVELRAQGLTYREIGNRFGVSHQRVHQLLTGYKPKPPRTPQRRRLCDWRSRHPEAAVKHNYDMASQRKLLVITHYGNGKAQCVKCGFSDIRALSIDHITAIGAHNRGKLAGQLLYQHLIKANYPIGFQTLCMNCQWIKRHENREFGNHLPQGGDMPGHIPRPTAPQLSLAFSNLCQVENSAHDGQGY